jgi:3-deoxy-manno-octulosonate cytidylyltransferase (CMP-KDO synthetase)
MKNVLGVIPARYASTRLPGKPLADIHGKPMIQWVWERVTSQFATVVIATDDQRIMDAVKKFGGHAIMTSAEHQSGTMRVAEIAEKFPDYDYFINIQGDQPTIDPRMVPAFARILQRLMQPDETVIGTLITEASTEDAMNPNVAKVVLNHKREALYFSRSPIPYMRDPEGIKVYKHLGVYGYTHTALKEIAQLEMSDLERAEKLEQLNWLFHGLTVRTAHTPLDSNKISVDTPYDLEVAKELLK